MNFIETLLSLTIFSLFFLIVWEGEQRTFRNLSQLIKNTNIQFKLNQVEEKNRAYP